MDMRTKHAVHGNERPYWEVTEMPSVKPQSNKTIVVSKKHVWANFILHLAINLRGGA
jgi:hypothetical protein